MPAGGAEARKETPMRALCWHGPKDIRCDQVPDPKIEHPRDAIVKVTSCAICGSDLHLYDGYIPEMENGDVMGHEFMGEVVEMGAEVNGALKVGDRVVVPFTIICGQSEQCRRGNFSVCERTNRNTAASRSCCVRISGWHHEAPPVASALARTDAVACHRARLLQPCARCRRGACAAQARPLARPEGKRAAAAGLWAP